MGLELEPRVVRSEEDAHPRSLSGVTWTAAGTGETTSETRP
jgi:hypothetical protein